VSKEKQAALALLHWNNLMRVHQAKPLNKEKKHPLTFQFVPAGIVSIIPQLTAFLSVNSS
jgi:hypothetical protein